eukprot:CAMPEP_0195523854 /NCGR_PEP_ID=MMETSP0794_2-20130614/23318_1 /TAXON_ID=515487 /ORGANISM="Stephanopyxis turris, Strain CCMP 815" /LENGTH=43 /DNA_ID= /DNA_START= /DNA_END= /DNA_ORIENTATION=
MSSKGSNNNGGKSSKARFIKKLSNDNTKQVPKTKKALSDYKFA